LLTNTTYNALLNKYEFIIVPTLNADGYVYTWTTNREWRKTRTGPVSGCYGTDPNRKYAFIHFMLNLNNEI
jgi:murein tripeptide amidase MpaA